VRLEAESQNRLRFRGLLCVLLRLLGLFSILFAFHDAARANPIDAPSVLRDASSSIVSDGPVALGIGDEWHGLYLKGRKIGYFHLRKQRLDDGYLVDDDMVMHVNVMGQQREITSHLFAHLDERLVARDFVFSLNGGSDARLALRGKVDGLRVDLEVDNAGEVTHRSIKLDEPPIFDFGIRPILANKGLMKSRARFKMAFFDPSILGTREILVEVLGREKLVVMGRQVEATVLLQNLGGVDLKAWVASNGETLKEELPMGLIALRETEQEARGWLATGTEKQGFAFHGFSGSDTPLPDLIQESSVPLKGRSLMAGEPEELTSVKLRLLGLADVSRLDLDGGRQTYRSGVLEIRRWAISGDAGSRARSSDDNARAQTQAQTRVGAKVKGHERAPTLAKELSDALEPEFLVQSDHPEIVAAAKDAAGAATGMAALRRLTKWVFGYLDKTNVVGLPSALETLHSKRGDCNEHAALLTSMLRAIGIPARVDVGLVHLQKRFYYHAWVEAYVDGHWVEVDPTFGQVPADVLHVRLVRGGLERQVEIMGVLNALKAVKVVASTRMMNGYYE